MVCVSDTRQKYTFAQHSIIISKNDLLCSNVLF